MNIYTHVYQACKPISIVFIKRGSVLKGIQGRISPRPHSIVMAESRQYDSFAGGYPFIGMPAAMSCSLWFTRANAIKVRGAARQWIHAGPHGRARLNACYCRANRNASIAAELRRNAPSAALFLNPAATAFRTPIQRRAQKQAQKRRRPPRVHPGRPSHIKNIRCEFRPPRCPPPDWRACGYRRRWTMQNTDDPSRSPRGYTTPLPLSSAAAALVVSSLFGS